MVKVAKKEEVILNYVNEHGFVSTISLANYFKMTPQSIRRYTKSLSDKGLISRSHGGVAKIDFNGITPTQVNSRNFTNSLKVKSLSLICFEPIHGNSAFATKVAQFLYENSRVDPLIYSIIETACLGWASNEADKILRRITRSQVAIFCETITDATINVALIARKREFETFLICQDRAIPETLEVDLLKAEHVGLMTFEEFQSEWKYARI